MARYGEGAERFNSSAKPWQGGISQYEEMLRKEQAIAEAAGTTAGFESESALAAQRATRARAEGADIARRQAASSGEVAQAAKLEAAAIERAAVARERANAAVTSPTGRRPANALRGGLDPLIYQAYGLTTSGGEIPTQYALRKQFPIGSYRARDMEEALKAGSAPPGATPVNVRRAQILEVEAEQALATANRELANIRKRQSASAAQIGEALSEKELAQANLQAARARTVQAREEAAAHQGNVEAIRTETAAREKAAASAAAAPPPGTALVPRREFIPGALGGGPLEGQYPHAPISQPTRYPQNIQESNDFATGTRGLSQTQITEGQARASRIAAVNLAAQAESAQSAGQAMAGFAEREAAVAAATNRAAVIQRLYSDEMHRHGALTAEFIQATARGEVTLREFGNEMLVTIGKFAGWTAAASAVYGAFRVINDIRTGAVAAQSAVEGLTRFIDPLNQQKAYSGVLGLSQQTNVPVQDVGDVAQVFARRFNNPQTGLTDTLTATHTALLAYKLDQISTADSTKFLMAITQEWGISAQRLPGLFDQISAAQRRYGARVAETLPALARSSAAVKNQGGDLNQLLALLALAQVRSGQTGAVVGQAFTRSASNFFRRPDNVAIERSYGLNPEEGYTQFLIDAVKRAQTLNGRQRAELGKAIGGPAFGARIFQTLLNAPQAQLNKFIGGTSPESTKGSAEAELHHVLGQADQQFQQIGNTLQRIGGYLAQSGLLTFAGLLLRGVNGALGGVESLLRLFSQLPAPLSATVGLLGEIAVAMRLLGRFGVGQRLQSLPVVGAFVQPGARLRQRALSDQNAVTEAARRQLETDSANAYTVQRSRQHFLDRARPGLQNAAAELQSGVSDPRRRVFLQQYIGDLERETHRQADLARLADEDVAISRQRLATEQENLAAIKASTARNIEATLAGKGLTVTPLPRRLGEPGYGEVPHPVTGSEFLAQTEARGALVNNSASGAAVQARLQRALIASTPVLGRMGRTGELLDSAAGRASEFTARAVTSVDRSASSLGRFVGKTDGLVRSLGAFDYALIGIPVLLELKNALDQAGADQAKALAQIDALQQPSSAEAARANRAAAKTRANKGPSWFQRLTGADPRSPSVFGKGLDFVAAGERAVGFSEAESPAEAYRAQQRAAQESQDSLDRIRRLQARDAKRGPDHAVANRNASDIIRDIDNSANAARAGLLSQAEINRALVKYNQEVQGSYEAGHGGKGSQQAVEAARAAITRLAAAGGDADAFVNSLKKLNDADLTKAITSTADALQQFGPASAEGKQALDQLRHEYDVATARWGPAGSAPNQTALSAAQKAFLGAATQAAQAAIQDGLAYARNEAERTQAYNRAGRLLTQQLVTPAHSFTVGGEHGTAGATAPRRARDAAAAQTLRDQRAQLRDQRYQDEEAGRQAALALAQSRSVDQARNSRLAVESARKQVDSARRRYGADSRQYEQALTGLNNARQQQATAILNQIQAEGSLLQAQAGNDPQAQARAAVRSAQRALAYMRAHAGEFDPTAILQARATLVQAENAMADQVRQNALDLLQLRGQIATARAHGDPVAQARAALQFARLERSKARNVKERLQATLDFVNANNDLQDAVTQREQDRFTFLESLTTDPVKQAGLEVRRTALALKQTHPGTSAYYQAQAQYHQALQSQQQARLQAQEDDIDFQLQMERITADQAISRYKSLLHLHNLTKQERRDILLKIHQLEQQEANDAGGFALRVGNVKLPTVYDVHRALGEARRGGDGGSRANFHNNITAHVTVATGADVRDVFNELDRQLGTSVTGQMRLAGLTV